MDDEDAGAGFRTDVLAKRTCRAILLNVQVNPALIGGLLVDFGDKSSM
jgi:F0F1-type ATP synthase delta subunit